MLKGNRGQGGGGGDIPTGITVAGGRRQSICQLVFHRLQIVTTYLGHFISVPSAVTMNSLQVQLKKLIRVRDEDIQEVHVANHNRSNSASYDGLSGAYPFLLQFTDGNVFQNLVHP